MNKKLAKISFAAVFGLGFYFYSIDESHAFLDKMQGIAGAIQSGNPAQILGAFKAILDQLSEEAKKEHQTAVDKASKAKVGEEVRWEEPNQTKSVEKSSGSITRVSEISTLNGKQCAEFEETVSIGGQNEKINSTRCLENGVWEMQV